MATSSYTSRAARGRAATTCNSNPTLLPPTQTPPTITHLLHCRTPTYWPTEPRPEYTSTPMHHTPHTPRRQPPPGPNRAECQIINFLHLSFTSTVYSLNCQSHSTTQPNSVQNYMPTCYQSYLLPEISPRGFGTQRQLQQRWRCRAKQGSADNAPTR